MQTTIPKELLELRQWVVSDDTKRPFDPKTKTLADVTNPDTWATYEQAIKAGYPYIGFVFTKNDPFVFIDLDNKEDDPNRTLLHQEIIKSAGGTYIERSKSGKGYHIVLRGEMESGRRSSENGLEIYPHERFMLMTGNSLGGNQISNGQELINYLVNQCGQRNLDTAPTISRRDQTDEQVLASAKTSYGKRFEALWSGNWDALHTSQSEADLELCGKLAEFTSDDQQVHDLFLQSALGQRDKAKRYDYLAKHTLPKARVIGDRERGAYEHGKAVALVLLSKWKASKKALLIPFGEFINRKVAILKLVKGVLGEGGLSVLYGAPGAGKSFLALDLSYALATGQPWMGREVSQGAVIYACGEGVSGFTRRAAGLALTKGESTPPIYILPSALSTPDELDQFRDMLKEVGIKSGEPPKLLVLDTLSRYYGDGEDENSAKDMKRFVKAVGSLQEEFPKLHIMVVHHSGKDADRGMRGSSVLLGAADTVISCRKNNDQHIALIEKQKDGQENIPLAFVLDEIELGHDEDGEPITTCVVKPDLDGRARPLKGHEATAVKILRMLKEVEIERGAGNLAGVMTQIPLDAYRNHWYQERPNDKKNSVKKNADNQLRYLHEKKLIAWNGAGSDIELLPALDSVTLA